MKTLNVVDITVVERGKHYADELHKLAAPRGTLLFHRCPEKVREKLRNAARNLFVAIEALEAEMDPSRGDPS